MLQLRVSMLAKQLQRLGWLQVLSKIKTDQGVEIQSFLLVHEVVQQRILLLMLIEQKIIFTPSQKLFKEIMRFLEKSSKNKHIIYESCCVQKNKSYFTMKKIEKSYKNL